MALFVKKCPCLRPKIEEDVRVLDYRHCSLTDVPGEVFNFERTLEELLVDSNQIGDLPRELFYCHGLRKLCFSDNEIKTIPPAIETLISLEHLDLSKNGVIDIPETIKTCKYLQVVDASVNPLGKLPEGFTQLLNLTQLYLNDTFLDYLPGNFGRLSRLKILELRENHLKTLPKSFSRLTDLEKLDIGHNEFNELPDVIGSLSSLLELWCDHNQIATITPTIGNLKQLMFFDGSKNSIQSLPSELDGCTSLADLHLTTNQLQGLPDSIGNLSNLTTLKVDDNHLTALPHTVGGMSSLSELNVSANDLQDLPPSLGLLRYLRTLYADENLLEYIPAELGSCSGITVLSLRSNKLAYIPDELGRIPRLRVLNLSSNQLQCLPFTFVKLKELQALWLSENQTRPLIPLQSEYDPDTGRKLLTCYLLPQRPPQDSGGPDGDNDSFHASMWEEERHQRQMIHFEFGDDSDVDGHLIRQPTPYPKEMREKLRHIRNMQMRQSMSNGVESRAQQGQDNHAYDKSPSSERSQNGSSSDLRKRESRNSKPGSPSLHDPYTLFKFDKEKFAKDKARIQQRRSSQSGDEDDRSPRKQSLPILPSQSGDRTHKKGTPSRVSSSLDPDQDQPSVSPDLCPSCLIRQKTKVNASKEGFKFFLHFIGKDRRSKGVDEDDGGFGEHRVCSLGSTPDISSTVESQSRSHQNRLTYCSPNELSHSVSQRSDHRNHNSHHHSNRAHRHRKMRDYDSDTGYRSDQELMKFRQQQEQMFERLQISNGDNYCEIVPVASRLGRRKDGYSSDLEGYSQRSSGVAYRDVTDNQSRSNNTQGLPSALNQSHNHHNQSHNEKSPHVSRTVHNNQLYEPNVSSSSSQPVHYPPSPSPFHRSRIVDQSTPMTPKESSGTESSVSRSQGSLDKHSEDLYLASDHRESDSPADSQNRYMLNDSLQSSSSSKSDRPALPPYKPAPSYTSSPGQRKLPTNPHRTSPYNSASNYDRQLRASPVKEFHQRTMPDIKEISGSNSELARSRSKSLAGNSNSLMDREKPGYNRRYSTENWSGKFSEINNRGINVDSSRGNYMEIAPESPRTPTSHSANVSNLSSAAPGDITSASSKDSGNYSYREHLSMMESPSSKSGHNSDFHRSPVLSVHCVQECQNSPQDYSSEQMRNFNGYDNTFREPPTVDMPTKYDDIAIFKSSELPDQISSSTDSGYGHGHNLFDRFNEAQRFSGTSQGSPSPDQFNSESPCTNSPQREVNGQYSRGATPVNQHSTDGRQFDRFRVTITKNPGLGFSIAGGVGSYGNPFRPGDMGIFVTKVQHEGPASVSLQPGDKLLEVNGIDYSQIQHNRAVELLKATGSKVSLLVERDTS